MRNINTKLNKEELRLRSRKIEFNVLNKQRNDLLTRFKISKNPTVQTAFANRLREIDDKIADIYREIFPEHEEMTTKEIFEMITQNPTDAQ